MGLAESQEAMTTMTTAMVTGKTMPLLSKAGLIVISMPASSMCSPRL